MPETTAIQAKETKAQRVERLKREKNPWECIAEIREFARQGRASIPPEWAGVYFKWWGIYTQGDGVGAIGGRGGEGKATEHFMMRVGIPNGIVNSSQLRTIGRLAERYARGQADITVRQLARNFPIDREAGVDRITLDILRSPILSVRPLIRERVSQP